MQTFKMIKSLWLKLTVFDQLNLTNRSMRTVEFCCFLSFFEIFSQFSSLKCWWNWLLNVKTSLQFWQIISIILIWLIKNFHQFQSVQILQYYNQILEASSHDFDQLFDCKRISQHCDMLWLNYNVLAVDLLHHDKLWACMNMIVEMFELDLQWHDSNDLWLKKNCSLNYCSNIDWE